MNQIEKIEKRINTILEEMTGVRFTSPAYMKQFKDYSLPAWVQYGMDENPQYGAMIEGMKG